MVQVTYYFLLNYAAKVFAYLVGKANIIDLNLKFGSCSQSHAHSPLDIAGITAMAATF